MTVSNSKRYVSGLLLALWALSAVAEELPHGSILQRFGVSPDQLPAGQAGSSMGQAPAPARFHLEPEQPALQLRLGDDRPPESTGNISIDNANARERARCRQLRDELVRRGKAMGVFCEPGQAGLPWSP